MDIKEIMKKAEETIVDDNNPHTVIKDLKKEIYELNKTLEIYGIKEKEYVDDLEYIYTVQLQNLRIIADNGILSPDDVKVLDSCGKGILKLRGKEKQKEAPGRDMEIGELIKLVDCNE